MNRFSALLLAALIAVATATGPAMAQKGQSGAASTTGGEEAGEIRSDLVEAFLGTLPATFQVEGSNADGSTYTGTAQLSFNFETFTAAITWQVGADTFQGQGPLEAGRFIIDWGQDTPVIYTVNEDLGLNGTWAGGAASETLTAAP